VPLSKWVPVWGRGRDATFFETHRILQTSSRHKLGLILKLQFVHSYRRSVAIICNFKTRMISGTSLNILVMCVNCIITELTSVATKKRCVCVCVCVCVRVCVCVCVNILKNLCEFRDFLCLCHTTTKTPALQVPEIFQFLSTSNHISASRDPVKSPIQIRILKIRKTVQSANHKHEGIKNETTDRAVVTFCIYRLLDVYNRVTNYQELSTIH
jgi:hypothetical protein